MLETNEFLPEGINIVAFPPIDLANAAGLATPYVSLKHYSRATVLLHKAAAGSGVEHPVMTFDQATAIAGTGTKPLTVSRIYKKISPADLESIGVWTLVTQAAGATFTGVSTEEALYAIDIRSEDLDVDNGFDCFRCTIADVGTVAQIGALSCLLWGARYKPLLSPLVN